MGFGVVWFNISWMVVLMVGFGMNRWRMVTIDLSSRLFYPFFFAQLTTFNRNIITNSQRMHP